MHLLVRMDVDVNEYGKLFNNWIQDTERRQTKQKTKKIQNILKMIRAVFTLFQNPFLKYNFC
jgi:hypothetical protein